MADSNLFLKCHRINIIPALFGKCIWFSLFFLLVSARTGFFLVFFGRRFSSFTFALSLFLRSVYLRYITKDKDTFPNKPITFLNGLHLPRASTMNPVSARLLLLFSDWNFVHLFPNV